LKAAGQVIDTGVIKPAMLALGMHTSGFRRVEFNGSRKDLRKFIARMVIESSNTKLNKAQIQLAVDREVTRAQIRGEKLQGRYQAKWLLWVDMEKAKKGQMVFNTPKSFDDIRLENNKSVLTTPLRMAIGVSLLQFFCITKTIADYGKALDGDKTEAGWRLFAGGLGAAGNLIETTGAIMKNLTEVKLPWAQGTMFKATAKWLEIGGKFLGTVGAAIMAVWDVMKGWEEWDKGNKDVAKLFFASGVLGLASAYMLSFVGFFNVFTILVVLAFIGITIWLDRVKDNALQGWLEACVFGIEPKHRDAEHSMQQFQLAIS
jgi:hypothetical protein